ncbi:hypothetical protein [Octadecabacter ascidiaceicola]|uniref:Uncharacterized protein n=1 Tax=Octadecabacter ascidiaceicola TaxID=1655543 RepID=A0A238JP57_9RHOB|nr:hypothetical protein [Octadecabacter ascidiaceicola]SMX32223.1 hypothetical protein OCA8868_00672 [Octadecabacter ascidiaceicola]
MIRLSVLLALCGAPALAQCPDPSLDAVQYDASGPELITPQTWEVQVGGAFLAPCPQWAVAGIDVQDLDGFLPAAPTAVFGLDAMAPHILMVMAQAECTPVLAVRSGDGQWFFGSDANGRQEVTLWGAPNGPLQVWVGAATPDGCAGTVTLETFDR